MRETVLPAQIPAEPESPVVLTPSPRHIPLESVQNCRDLGGLPIRNAEGLITAQTRQGLLFRSSRPVFASERDTDFLLNTLAIKSIVDLRTSDEQKRDANSALLSHFSSATKKQANLTHRKLPLGAAGIILLVSAFIQRRDIAQRPSLGLIGLMSSAIVYLVILKIQQRTKPIPHRSGGQENPLSIGATGPQSRPDSSHQPRNYFPVSIADNEFLRRGVVGLTPYSVQVRFLAWLLVGRKDKAACVLVKSTLNEWDLAEFYTRLLKYAQPQIARCMDIFIEPSNYPIMFHCTHGKDRTGVIAALVLGCVGVNLADITDDYAISARHPLPQGDVGNRTPAGMDKEHFQNVFLSAHPENIQGALRFVQEQYGGVPEYLAHIGFGRDKQERLRQIFASPPVHQPAC